METTYNPGDLIFKRPTEAPAFIEGSRNWEEWNFEKGKKLAGRILKQEEGILTVSVSIGGVGICFKIPVDSVIIVPEVAEVCWSTFQQMPDDWDEGPHADLLIEAYDFWKSEDGLFLKELNLA